MASMERELWKSQIDMLMNEELAPKTANRLALGLARQRRIHYREAEAILRSLTLKLVIDAASCRSVAFQAALLTGFNTGNRAFLGGVSVEMPADVELLLPLPGFCSLNEALGITGFTPREISAPSQTIYFGLTPAEPGANSCRVDCDGWRGVVSDFDCPASFEYGNSDDIALGGIFAGGLAVHRCFLKAANIPARSLESPLGLSLWSPGSDWRKPVSSSPLLCNLPNRFWVLGLGHLGQAFLWNLALLPFPNRQEVQFLLQDFDAIEAPNVGSGLLCTPDAVGRKKSGIVQHGWKTSASSPPSRNGNTPNTTARAKMNPALRFADLTERDREVALERPALAWLSSADSETARRTSTPFTFTLFRTLRSSPESLWEKVQDGPRKIKRRRCGAVQ